MKILKFIIPVFFLTFLFAGCSSDDDNINEPDPMKDLYMVYEFSEGDYSTEIYSKKPRLEVGYNQLSIRIKDLANDSYITQASPSWEPMMDMGDMEHSAPYSSLSSEGDGSIYKGYIVFQMAGDDHHGWELSLQFSHNGQLFEQTHSISVDNPSDGMVKTQVFTGTDDQKYILSYMEPEHPEVAINDMEAILYKMEDMMTFTIVEDYTITIDPRMPSMGNHSSPNNEDLTYNSATHTYKGKLSLSMTGYWKINLKLLNENNELLKGEDVTEDHPASSLYFEIEF